MVIRKAETSPVGLPIEILHVAIHRSKQRLLDLVDEERQCLEIGLEANGTQETTPG